MCNLVVKAEIIPRVSSAPSVTRFAPGPALTTALTHNSPVFFTSKSPKIVELFLQFDDLEVTNRQGKPLLWQCAERGLVTERVAADPKLRGQFGQKWKSRLPIEIGESGVQNANQHSTERINKNQAELCNRFTT